MAEPAGQLNRHGNTRGMHPASRANLRPSPAWKSGTSGNPEGLSLKRRVSDILREPKRSLSKKEAKKVKAIDLLARAIVEDAIKGSKEDRKEIWERLDGKLAVEVGMAGEIILRVVEDGGGVGHATGQVEVKSPSGGHPGEANNVESEK